MSQNEILSKRLAAARIKCNYTQEEIADYLQCSRVTITNYECGRRSPDYNSLVMLAKKYGVTTDYLLGVTNAETTDKDLRYICDYTGLSEQAIEELHTIYEMSLTGTCGESALVFDEKNMSDGSLKLLNAVKLSNKNFLNYLSEFILNLSIMEMTDNISEYLELTKEIEKNQKELCYPSDINGDLYLKKLKDKQDFYLFKISKNIQEAVKDLYEKEKR